MAAAGLVRMRRGIRWEAVAVQGVAVPAYSHPQEEREMLAPHAKDGTEERGTVPKVVVAAAALVHRGQMLHLPLWREMVELVSSIRTSRVLAALRRAGLPAVVAAELTLLSPTRPAQVEMAVARQEVIEAFGNRTPLRIQVVAVAAADIKPPHHRTMALLAVPALCLCGTIRSRTARSWL